MGKGIERLVKNFGKITKKRLQNHDEKIEKNEKENGQIMENVFQKNYRRIMKKWLENFEKVILKKMKSF